MVNEPTMASTASPSLRAAQVYAMAAVCLLVGLGIGYLLRETQSPAFPAQTAAIAGQPPVPRGAMSAATMPSQGASPASPAQPAANAAQPSPHAGAMGARHMPTPEEMKQIADKQAAPLLEKLKSDPNNSALLNQLAAIYHVTHQFKEAAIYYGKAVQVDPKNVAVRNKWASSLYYSGDVDGAIAQLNKALSYDPKDANSLFNLGMIKLQGKQDGKGALAAWQQLLKTNPQLSADRKATVQKLMANVLTTLGDQNGIEGARGNDGHK